MAGVRQRLRVDTSKKTDEPCTVARSGVGRGDQMQREWMGIEPTSRRVNDDSTALKAAGPTRRPDTPRKFDMPSKFPLVQVSVGASLSRCKSSLASFDLSLILTRPTFSLAPIWTKSCPSQVATCCYTNLYSTGKSKQATTLVDFMVSEQSNVSRTVRLVAGATRTAMGVSPLNDSAARPDAC